MSTIYHFGEFRLDLATRELWQREELADLARRTFDGLAYLVERRDRAVSRDELTEALWGRPVEDIQVTQLVMRLRRLLGDDSQEPRFIRAVPGFGYRWIAETHAQPVAIADGDSEQAGEAPVVAGDRMPAAGRFPRPAWIAAGVAVIAVMATLATYLFLSHHSQAGPLAREPGEAIVVMPLAIDEAIDSGIGWARLGAMDLIGERMRNAGLPVSPSESVISAIQAAEGQSEADFPRAIRNALGADIIVRGAVRRADDGWVVGLTATTSEGRERRIESPAAEVIPAAESAAKLLLAALGHPAPVVARDNEAVSERVQRARAASLALELDAARSILTGAPEALRNEPALRLELAWIELRAGRPEAVLAITRALLDDAGVEERPRLKAQILMAHGVALVQRAGGWHVGEKHFDAAVSVLEEEPWVPELGRALVMRSASRTVAHDFDDAARDLGRARTLFEAGGNRAGMAQVENYFGNLELERGRPSDALVHFGNALEIDTGFSNVDGIRANISAMQRAQMQLLRWPDALASSERLWELRDQFQQPVDPHRRHSLNMHRVEVLIALGRHSRARTILAEVADMRPEIPPHGLRYELQLRARLALQQGQWPAAMELSRQALDVWFSRQRPATRQPIELALLHQRASIEAGRPVAAHELLPSIPEVEREPGYLIARAEWAAHVGNHEVADGYFEQAARRAETLAVPALYVLVADAYARWLVERGRLSEAVSVAGRVARWADRDFDSALLQVMVLHASEREEALRLAMDRARRLAGEREIPERFGAVPQ